LLADPPSNETIDVFYIKMYVIMAIMWENEPFCTKLDGEDIFMGFHLMYLRA